MERVFRAVTLALLLAGCAEPAPTPVPVPAGRTVIVIEFVVGPAGAPRDLTTVAFQGPADDRKALEDASYAAVRRWRFRTELIGRHVRLPIYFEPGGSSQAVNLPTNPSAAGILMPGTSDGPP